MTNDNDARGALTVRVEKTAGGPNLYIGSTLVRYWVGCAFDGEAEALADAIRSALAAPSLPAGDGLTERKRFDAWAAKHMTMDGYPAYTAWDAWQAAILAAPRQPGEMGAGVRQEIQLLEQIAACGDTWDKQALLKQLDNQPAASAHQDEREAFEAWAIEQDINITPGYPRGVQRDYAYMEASYAWRVWQGISKWRAAQQVQANAGAVAEADDLLRACHRWHAGDGHTKKRIENVREALAVYTRPTAESDKRDMQAEKWRLDSEELEAFHMSMDKHGVPRATKFGVQMSAFGRAVKFAAMSREQSGGDRG